MIKFTEMETHPDSRDVTQTWRSENTDNGHYDAFLYDDGTYYLKYWPSGKGARPVARGIKSFGKLQELANIHDLCISDVKQAVDKANDDFFSFLLAEGLEGRSILF